MVEEPVLPAELANLTRITTSSFDNGNTVVVGRALDMRACAECSRQVYEES